jgi:fido (protein-threonine AMPylation protein)
MRDHPDARARFQQLTGLDWAEHNYGLDEGCDEALSEAATLHCSGVYKPQAHKDAVQLLLRLADEKEFLGGDDLLELHRALLSDVSPQAGQFRQQSATPLAPGHEPTEAELVGPVIDNALGWFQSESFGQMHEVEKSALMLIKLLDVQPFDDGNGRTLRLFSNFFLLQAGYPPAIIPTSQASEYALAVQSSLRFDTQPIIDLIADAADRSLRWCLGEPPAPPKLKVLSH